MSVRRIWSLPGILMLGLFLVLAPQQSARAERVDGPIASTALQYLGTHGGQCWTFMQQVVAEATGRRVGYDYRQGFFEAGATEVSASEARNGDVIQIAEDGNTQPWASYSGLHTAIVLENLGGGRFDAIDSNQNWDEMVRLRPNYDPYAAARRYGLDVHIYRIPGGGPGDAPTAYTEPTLAVGDHAKVAADPGCLNLRGSASLAGKLIGCLPSGSDLTVVGGPETANGYTWLQVSSAKGTGWVAARYLVAAAAPPAEAVSGADEPQDSPVAAQSTPEPTLPIAHVDNSPGCLRVRSGAGTSGSILDCLPAGTAVTVVDATPVEADGYAWLHVRVEGRVDGWVASEFLIR